MNDFMKKFAPKKTKPLPKERIFIRNGCRLSLISDRILRVEVQNSSVFCDMPTQAVINRTFADVDCTFSCDGRIVTVKSDSAEFRFDIIGRKMVGIRLNDGRFVTDFKSGNLKGTGRTLDNTNGYCRLCDGVISKNGVAVLDDGDSLILTYDGHIRKRKCEETDLYYFAYGFDYNGAVCDYFNLTGFPPLIPRFALGNWWSRYKAYTQEEYQALMDRFEAENIPLTVATVDMDWHWVDIKNKFGAGSETIYTKNNLMEKVYSTLLPGWTGYSWNTELFPDPSGFLNFLKGRNLHITMNLHPAAGCRWFEDAYSDFCEFLGKDPKEKETIRFDLSDDRFIEGYFRFLHRPHEEKGVDFWWIDWQQGKNSDVKGLDPLSALNRYHYIDNSGENKRGLILSRFSGAGAHRYPIGFSGDTVMSWASLNYQPYFTSTASNIGYTWWSHDIGGHTLGVRDDELYLRWVQYGVFSPIMRLHSTSNEFMGKEPWMYRSFVAENAAKALRLRHRLIPYIYTANYKTAVEGQPLIRPMYYADPKNPNAYKAKNEYYFGTELIVCPITEKINPKTELAGTDCYLPDGRWTDIFTGRIYNGKKMLKLFRDEASIPVLAKAGAIIPMYSDDQGNSTDNPEKLDILLFRGHGNYELYEDDGVTNDRLNGKYCKTRFISEENGDSVSFIKKPCEGDYAIIPEKRSFKLIFRDITGAESVTVTKNGRKISFKNEIIKSSVSVTVSGIKPDDELSVILENRTVLKNPSEKEMLTALFSRIQGFNDIKKMLFEPIVKKDAGKFIPFWLREAVKEIRESEK